MSTLSRQKTWSAGDTLTASDLNAEFDNVVNDYNGSITNANIAAGAAITSSKISGTAVTLAGTETLTNKTLTSPTLTTPTLTSAVLNTAVSGTAFLDEDDMSSDSATQLASQQSIKKYVDDNAGTMTYAAYSPTTANITQGNGTIVARYAQIGKFVHGRFLFQLGSTSAMGSSPTFTLPVAAHADYGTYDATTVGTLRLWDNNTTQVFNGTAVTSASTTVVTLRAIDSTTSYGTNATITSSVPFTWATSDELSVNFSYEAA